MRRLLLLVAFLAVTPAQAQSNLTLGDVTLGGTACQGTGAVTVGQNFRVVTISFTDYRAEAGAGAASSVRATCNVAVPVDVPAGMSVAVASSDYRLSAKLNPGATGVVSMESFFAGDQGTPLVRTITGPTGGTLVASNSIRPDLLVWSGCGQDVILRANSSIRLSTDVATVLPSVAGLEQARIRLVTRSC
jgi:hypothetical protein